jgi:enoyl-CoA hydratase/carnithine racemase
MNFSEESMKDILLKEKREHICTLTLNRPESQNGLNLALLHRIAEEFKAIDKDLDIRVVILRGAGEKVFSLGIDLSGEVKKGKDPGDLPSDITGYDPAIRSMTDSIAACHCPVIAMIYGDALAAACDLAVCCDLRIATDISRLSMHPVRVGTTYQFEGLQRFINLVGVGYAKELFLTASPVSAKRALEMGLVNYVVPAKDLLSTTEALAKNIAELPPLAVSGTKEIITKLLRFQQTPTEKQIAELRAISAIARQSEDVKESVRALFEGRKPVYRGK